MTLAISPLAFKKAVGLAMDRAPGGTKRMVGYAALAAGIGQRYEIRLLLGGVVQATYTMSGSIPYSLSTGLAPTAAQIASIAQSGDIDVSSGTWTVEIASTVNAGYVISGTLGVSSTDFTFSGATAPTTPEATDIGPVGQVAADWVRTFTEEFDGGSLDSSKWIDEIWYGDDYNDGSVTNYDVNDSSNSCLRIWPATNSSNQWFFRTINTDTKFEQQYGFFEARMKLPVGKGVWPAFWLFSHTGGINTEIDVMEAYNGGASGGWSTDAYQPNNFGASMHYPNVLGSQGPYKLTEFQSAQRLDTDFHTYGVKWTATTISFFFDGQLLVERAFAIPHPMFILLDIWYGSAAGTPNTTDTPRGASNSLIVDYVRVWEAA